MRRIMAKKNEMEERDDMTTDGEGGASRVYELGFHIDPELPSEEVKKVYQTIRAVVTEQGTLVAEGEPQKIPLAYTISRQEPTGRRDFDSAFFAWIAYETSAENHDVVLASMRNNNRIVRFIDLVTTKDAARHAAEMHELAMQIPEKTEDAAVSEAELDAAIEGATV